MMIENNTSYSRTLKYIIGNDSPSFEIVRDVATAILKKQPNNVQQSAYDSLERGTAVLYHGLQMDAFLYAYGRMHQAKLNYAFKHIPETFLVQNEINIIDYGCGLGTGIMCFADFLRKYGFVLKVNTITLIEPSEPTLKRAALHSRLFFPKANIITINKGFDQLSEKDIVCQNEIPTLHILSNVLDLDFDIERFSLLIRDCLKGYNQFVCTGPCFNDYEKDERMELFSDCLNGDNIVYDTNNELEPNKDWTCAICCFNVGNVLIKELSNVDSLVLYPIINSYQPEKVFLNPIDDFDEYKRQFTNGNKIKLMQNQDGFFESFTIIKRKKKSFEFGQIFVCNTCDFSKPLHIDYVSKGSDYYTFIDNQWDVDLLIQMNPFFKRDSLVINSKYYKIEDLNAFMKGLNGDGLIEFNINRFGVFETIKSININAKEESVRIFIRPTCNTKKPMSIRILETNYEGKQYYAFVDNQLVYSNNHGHSAQYQQYIRIGKTFKQVTRYRIGVFEYEDFCTMFNEGKAYEFEHVHGFWVSYSELKAVGSTAIVTLFADENLDREQPIIVELYHDTYSNKITGTLNNVEKIIEL